MILIIILLVVALLLVGVAYFFFSGMPDSRTHPGKNLRLVLLGTGLVVVGALGVSIAIQVQEQTGVEIAGLSGGIESDARQWISRHKNDPPAANQVGDNIRILREGLAFLNTHPTVGGSPRGQQVIAQYSVLPERPTKLLTRQQEIDYYEGARAVYTLIDQIANPEANSTGESE